MNEIKNEIPVNVAIEDSINDATYSVAGANLTPQQLLSICRAARKLNDFIFQKIEFEMCTLESNKTAVQSK